MPLISKLCSFPWNMLGLPVLPLEPSLEPDVPSPDLLEREAMDCAKRAVLPALGGGRMVVIVFVCEENAAGVEVIGLSESLSRDIESVMSDA